MIIPKGSWMFFKVERIKALGGIVLPDNQQKDKDEVTILAVGPDVRDAKIGDKVILTPRDCVQYSDPDCTEKSFHGFAKEENIIALVVDNFATDLKQAVEK